MLGLSQKQLFRQTATRCLRSVQMQGAEIEGEGAYWSMWLSLNIESNAAVGHLWDTAKRKDKQTTTWEHHIMWRFKRKNRDATCGVSTLFSFVFVL